VGMPVELNGEIGVNGTVGNMYILYHKRTWQSGVIKYWKVKIIGNVNARGLITGWDGISHIVLRQHV